MPTTASAGRLTPSSSKTHLRLGYVAQAECAPLVVAQRLRLAEQYGMTLELCRQPSWSALRDKLLRGELDAAQMLHGMAYGIQLGLGGQQADMAVLMTLSQNGQAITLSNALADAVMAGSSLRMKLVDTPRRRVFAHTFPTGTHALWLFYWLAAQGIHPLNDVRSVTVPPTQMAESLARGELDGYCAGEPWSTLASNSHHGTTVVTSSEIWPDHPEKALTCRLDFVKQHPDAARALIRILLEACQWLDDPALRPLAAPWLATPEVIGQPEHLILARLLGDYGKAPLRQPARPIRFFAGGEVNYPWLSDGLWFLSQFKRWGMTQEPASNVTVVKAVNQTALFAEAAGEAGVAVPPDAYRTSILMDGQPWNGINPEGYASSFSVRERSPVTGPRP
ncbi:nitrate/nitrite transport system substrate-binding protein [Silvimonas terrae]|uniref:Nitrate/nitrite transport system substrate-binding protein n=1 Tax=Silvimonas terrae TaxID=300266 RepID=A0A840RMS1_9NEIS|nr:CmpA/NrtA family ABC transporter substrate-binding protein [Silvimonas terrae]MBB5193391.1 nitrate/nitrite transport system substrate-binding protein [Silvimonas terrae]